MRSSPGLFFWQRIYCERVIGNRHLRVLPFEGVFVKHPSISMPNRSFVFLLLAVIAPPLALAGCGENKTANKPAAESVKKENPASVAQAASFAPQTTANRKVAKSFANESSTAKDAVVSNVKYNAGEDPAFAKKCGWPVNCPAPLPGSILPKKRAERIRFALSYQPWREGRRPRYIK